MVSATVPVYQDNSNAVKVDCSLKDSSDEIQSPTKQKNCVHNSPR